MTIIRNIGVVMVLAAVFAGGWFAHQWANPVSPIPGEQVVYQPVESPPVIRDYGAPDKTDEALRRYDTDVFQLWVTDVIQRPEQLSLSLHGKLFERTASREAVIPLGSSGDWKFYAGVAVGGAAVAGAVYGGYQLVKVLK